MEHIKDCIAALREAAPEIDIAENELMRRHTTFAIGGPADLFVQPKTRRELTAALAVLRERNIPFLLLGTAPTCWWPMRASAVRLSAHPSWMKSA